MAPDRGWWLLLPKPVRRLPADLAATIGLALLTVLIVVLPGLRGTPIRLVLGVPFVLFLPGYAFVAALFPEADGTPDVVRGTTGDGGINGVERIVLAVGTSISLIPLVGLVLNFTPLGVRLTPVVLSVSGVTISCVAIAALRRWELPPERRFSVSYHEWIGAVQTTVVESDDRTDVALNVVLALAMLLALGSVGYAVAVPPDGERFTEFYLLTQDDDGELVAESYPEELVQGESQPLIVGIENHERETVEYTVVVQLQRVESDDQGVEVAEREELDRFETTVEAGETRRTEHELTPTMTGADLRVVYLLYTDEVPEEPTRENAYRDVHLRVDVR